MCAELYQRGKSINKNALISLLIFVMIIVMTSVKKFIKSGKSGIIEIHLDTDQKKRRRTTFSNSQLLELEREFRNSNYLSPHRLAEISKKLSLGSTQIKIWFKNRRRKSKVREDTFKEYKKIIENEANEQVKVTNPFRDITNIDINDNNVRHTKMPDISTGFDFYDKLPKSDNYNNNTSSYSNESSNYSQIMYSSNGITPPMWSYAISAL